MNNTNSKQDWKSNLNYLLDKLPLEERYICAAGIPGPALEMRSGTLPKQIRWNFGLRDFQAPVAEVTHLKYEKLRRYKKRISQEYTLFRIVNKYKLITPNLNSRVILFKDYLISWFHHLRGTSIDNNIAKKMRKIKFCLHNKNIKIVYPADLVSLGLLWEIFAQEAYYFKEPVETIYDIGANIGLSAVYLHLINPKAKIICIEPVKENLNLLKQNIKLNHINAEVIPAAAGEKKGEMSLYYSKQSHALPSLYTKQGNGIKVPIIPFNSIVKGKNYGLKIDIEGAEASLAKFPSIIKNAAWVVGELHYSENVERNKKIDKFFDIVKKNFIVKKSRPIIYFVGDNILLCETFKTIKKIS